MIQIHYQFWIFHESFFLKVWALIVAWKFLNNNDLPQYIFE